MALLLLASSMSFAIAKHVETFPHVMPFVMPNICPLLAFFYIMFTCPVIWAIYGCAKCVRPCKGGAKGSTACKALRGGGAALTMSCHTTTHVYLKTSAVLLGNHDMKACMWWGGIRPLCTA